MANKENIIDLVGITRCFEDGVIAVDNLDLHVKKGEFVTFLGPSGCGKTTTLRMIAGFDKPNQGKIYLNGKDITELPPYKRPINTVFQKYALFPHLNIFDNIAYGLKLKKLKVTYQDKDGNKRQVTDIIANEVEFLSVRNAGDGDFDTEPMRPIRSERPQLEPVNEEDLPF